VNDYIGLLNNIVVTGDIARIAKRFKQEAHIGSISFGETTFAAKIYKNDPVSTLLSTVFITIFSFSKILKGKVEVHDTSKMNGHDDQNLVTDKVEGFVNKD
jgi:hypothetical protein